MWQNLKETGAGRTIAVSVREEPDRTMSMPGLFKFESAGVMKPIKVMLLGVMQRGMREGSNGLTVIVVLMHQFAVVLTSTVGVNVIGVGMSAAAKAV